MNHRSAHFSKSAGPNRYHRRHTRNKFLSGLGEQAQNGTKTGPLSRVLFAMTGAACGYLAGMVAPRYSLYGGIASTASGCFVPNEGLRTFMTSLGLSLTGTSLATKKESFKENFKEAREMLAVKAKLRLPSSCCNCPDETVLGKEVVPASETAIENTTNIPTEITGLGNITYFQYPEKAEQQNTETVEDRLMRSLDAVSEELTKHAQEYIAKTQQWQQQQQMSGIHQAAKRQVENLEEIEEMREY
ncbi:MAG TPA: hypothetical protein VJ552_05890 [Sediminibacterium sp.]|nr:hypothetical protein [Sediminibacterium sp.]